VWCSKILDTLKSVSPTSLKVTLAQIRRGAELSIAECFQMEYSMVAQFLKTPDFIEGVDAKLISKPARNPKWNPGRENMSILTDNVVDKLFFGWEQSKTPLQLYNRLSYHEYPHRTLSGLPGVRDIQRIIHDSKEYGKVKYHKKDEILEFFKKNWGHYDKSVMGDTKVPLRNSIQGLGYERVSLEERTRLILDAHVKETKQGLELISFERSNL
jgi:3-hydroxyisobutyryl-CoA hydrolase